MVFAVGLFAVSARAHGKLHSDAGSEDHLCAVTLAIAGYCDTAATLPAVAPDQKGLPTEVSATVGFHWSVPSYWHNHSQAPPA